MLGKRCLILLGLLVTSLVSGHGDDEIQTPANSDVISLTQADFHKVVDAEKLILVEFFAPWCGHCKALAPEYEQAATALKANDIKLAKVDCVAQTDLCNDFDVKGYPTLKVFRNVNSTDYNGPRKTDGIVSYMKKQAAPAVSDVTVENFDNFKDSDTVVIIGFFNINNTAEFQTLNTVANSLRDEYIFGQTGLEEVVQKAGVKAPAVVIYKKFDEGKNVHEGTFTEEELRSFIKTNAVPLLAEIGPENYANYVDSGLPLAYLFYETNEHREALGKAAEATAKEFKGKVNFVYIDAAKFGSHASNINLKEEWPAFGIQKPKDGLKYPFDQTKTIDAASIKDFVQRFVNGEIEPSIKSQPIPEKNDEPVLVLVAHEFEKFVYDPKKDVLVEFYAPWCGHCKKLAPTWDELGKLYEKAKDQILIAKMDATENDLPSKATFQISGFPTIKLFKAGAEKDIVDYSGNRTLESFVEFLESNAVNKVNIGTAEPAAEASSAPAETPSAKESATSEPAPVVKESPSQEPVVKESATSSTATPSTPSVEATTKVAKETPKGKGHDEL